MYGLQIKLVCLCTTQLRNLSISYTLRILNVLQYRSQCYKTFFVRNRLFFSLSLRVCSTRPEKVARDKQYSLLQKLIDYEQKSFIILGQDCLSMAYTGNTKGGSITVLLTSCLTGLESSILQKNVSSHIADFKPVKEEVNGTVIVPTLVFPGICFKLCPKCVRKDKLTREGRSK